MFWYNYFKDVIIKLKAAIFFIISLFFSIVISYGQDSIAVQNDEQNNSIQDTLEFEDFNEFARTDSVVPFEFQMQKSPSGAIWRSLAFPGWGQLYVESYWKAPVFAGAAVFMAYRIGYFHGNFTDYSDKVDALESELERLKSEDPNNPKINEIEYRTLPVEKNRREYYRDNRDMSAFYLLGVYALAAVDAYVGAHLFDFDVSDEGISYGLQPGLLFNSVNFKLSVSFSLEDLLP